MFNNKKIEALRFEFIDLVKKITKHIENATHSNLVAKDEIEELKDRIKKLESTKKPKVKS